MKRFEWRGQGLRLLALASLAAIPLLLLAVNSVLSREFESGLALRTAQEQSYETRAALLTLLSVHQDIETGQRGFVITGDPSFLRPYEAARAATPSAFARLEGALTNGSPLRSELARLQAQSRAKLVTAERAIDVAMAGDQATAQQLVAGGSGRRAMNALRATIARMDAIEQVRLNEAARGAEQARNRSQRLAFGLQTILVLLLAAAAFVVSRSLAARRRALGRAEEAQARQAAIFESAKDGILILNPSGGIESLNAAAARMYGYPREELLSRDVSTLFDIAPDRGQVETFLKRLRARRNGAAGRLEEFWGRRKDGSTFPGDVAVSPVPLADGMRYVAIVRDATERKEVERMKGEFVSTVSHELRTPLTSIAGSLGLLAGGAAGALPERAARLIQIARDNSERLVRLINDILDIEKIESGEMPFAFADTPLAPFLDQLIEANGGFAAQHKVEIEADAVPGDAAVRADPDRLAQVVTNLLSNAVKFSPEGGRVRVRVVPLDRRWRISIQDEGSGIPHAFRDRIFSRFAQADSSDTRRRGGTGLGLSIAREIVLRHGGAIAFADAKGGGTVFHVDIPSAAPARIPALPDILICGREAGLTGAAARKLEAAGFHPHVAATGADLSALDGVAHPALALMDAGLRPEEQDSLLRALRASAFAAVPVVLIAEPAAQGAPAPGRVEWAHPPVSLDDLLSGVGRALTAIAAERPTVLHVDDDADMLHLVASALEGRANLRSVESLAEARSALKAGSFDLFILDIALGDGSGLDLLPDVRRGRSGVPVIVFSAQDAAPALAGNVDAMLTKSRASLADLAAMVVALTAKEAG